MKLLLDACTFLWACSASEELSAVARAALEAPGNALYLSAASAWEIAVKHALGKLPLPAPPNDYVPEGRRALAADMLAIEEQHALLLAKLPNLHRDPFDRILVCQAIAEGMSIVTCDAQIHAYPVNTLW